MNVTALVDGSVVTERALASLKLMKLAGVLQFTAVCFCAVSIILRLLWQPVHKDYPQTARVVSSGDRDTLLMMMFFLLRAIYYSCYPFASFGLALRVSWLVELVSVRQVYELFTVIVRECENERAAVVPAPPPPPVWLLQLVQASPSLLLLPHLLSLAWYHELVDSELAWATVMGLYEALLIVRIVFGVVVYVKAHNLGPLCHVVDEDRGLRIDLVRRHSANYCASTTVAVLWHEFYYQVLPVSATPNPDTAVWVVLGSVVAQSWHLWLTLSSVTAVESRSIMQTRAFGLAREQIRQRHRTMFGSNPPGCAAATTTAAAANAAPRNNDGATVSSQHSQGSQWSCMPSPTEEGKHPVVALCRRIQRTITEEEETVMVVGDRAPHSRRHTTVSSSASRSWSPSLPRGAWRTVSEAPTPFVQPTHATEPERAWSSPPPYLSQARR